MAYCKQVINMAAIIFFLITDSCFFVLDVDFHAHQEDCSWKNFRETLRGLCTRSFTYFLQGISLLTRPQETASGAGVKGELQAKPRQIKPRCFILRKHMKEGGRFSTFTLRLQEL